jgi:hypothetical protein
VSRAPIHLWRDLRITEGQRLDSPAHDWRAQRRRERFSEFELGAPTEAFFSRHVERDHGAAVRGFYVARLTSGGHFESPSHAVYSCVNRLVHDRRGNLGIRELRGPMEETQLSHDGAVSRHVGPATGECDDRYLCNVSLHVAQPSRLVLLHQAERSV